MDHSKQLIARRSTCRPWCMGVILLDCPYLVSSFDVPLLKTCTSMMHILTYVSPYSHWLELCSSSCTYSCDLIMEGSTLIHKSKYGWQEILSLSSESSICGNTWYVNWPLSQFDQNTELRSALWVDFLERWTCWYGSEVERVRMHSSGMGSWLNHWLSLVRTWKNRTARSYDKLHGRIRS